MNITYLTDEILNDSSVETIHIDEICKNLGALGHAVTLYAPTAKNFQPPKSYRVRIIKGSKRLFSAFFQTRLFFHLRRDVMADRPDIIYCRHNHILFVPALIGRLWNIPVILEVNGQLLEEARYIDRSVAGRIFLRSGLFRFLEAFNFKSATCIVTVAEGIKESLAKNYKIDAKKIVVIQNGVDADFFKPVRAAAVRKKLALDEEALYVGYIGSFYPWQGLHYIMQAAKLLLHKRPKVKFLIIGKGSEENHLRGFVKDSGLEGSVSILPPVSHNIVPQYMNALDICICYPTKFRRGATSPFKVYEYLACGKPVVLADIEGMRKEFGDVVAYADAESPEALADSITRLVDEKNYRERLGAAGRKFVEQGHSWEAVTKQIVTICEKQSLKT